MSKHKSAKTKLLTTRVEIEILEAMERCVAEVGCLRNTWVKQALCAAIERQKMSGPDCKEADLAFLQK